MNPVPLVFVPTRQEAEGLLGHSMVGHEESVTIAGRETHWVLCGLGVASAAALCSTWMQRVHPPRAALVGLAGSYDLGRAPLGSVIRPTQVLCAGIGVGEDREFQPLPFPLIPEGLVGPHDQGDTLVIHGNATGETPTSLLSVTSAASSPSHAARRQERCPEAIAEAMEDYGAALAAAIQGIPLAIIRGISNRAGDRDHRQWQTHPALRACRKELERWLSEPVP